MCHCATVPTLAQCQPSATSSAGHALRVAGLRGSDRRGAPTMLSSTRPFSGATTNQNSVAGVVVVP
eukprot:7382677-Prymnesium_polylepis.1